MIRLNEQTVNFLKLAMVVKFLVLSCLIVLFGSGCALFTNPQGVMALKRYGDNQAQIQGYVDKQEKLFDKLVGDIEAGKLEKGMLQKKFIRSYGEPILSQDPDELGQEVFLYRYPTEYFNTDRVYVYFDDNKELIRWEYKPKKKDQ